MCENFRRYQILGEDDLNKFYRLSAENTFLSQAFFFIFSKKDVA